MAFSETVSRTTFNTRKVIDRAFGRCRMPAATITSEQIDIAKDALYLLISQLANHGVPLWCVEKRVYPLYDGVGDLVLDVGTVDVLSANLRGIHQVEGEVLGDEFSWQTTFKDEFGTPVPVPVSIIGIRWMAEAAPLTFERSRDALEWEVVMEVEPKAMAGEITWFDLPSTVSRPYFRIRTTDNSDFFYQSIALGNNPTEINLARLNRDDWSVMPNKFAKGRPVQYWFDRQVRRPVMHLWSVPNAMHEAYQIVLLVHRHIMDVGTLQQEVEFPQRWMDAVVAGLAVRLAREVPEVDPSHIPRLDGEAKEALYLAQQEERDNAPINWAPMIGVYTR